ncbi:MAG TPA: hypothetical protein VGK02_08995 [Candidatus Aquicultor sp.]|jgi:hypothetical protein
MSDIGEKVVAVASRYMGPAARRFIERQTSSHMNGLAIDNITPAHLPELAKWVEISAGLVMDKAKAAELANKIKSL